MDFFLIRNPTDKAVKWYSSMWTGHATLVIWKYIVSSYLLYIYIYLGFWPIGPNFVYLTKVHQFEINLSNFFFNLKWPTPRASVTREGGANKVLLIFLEHAAFLHQSNTFLWFISSWQGQLYSTQSISNLDKINEIIIQGASQ